MSEKSVTPTFLDAWFVPSGEPFPPPSGEWAPGTLRTDCLIELDRRGTPDPRDPVPIRVIARFTGGSGRWRVTGTLRDEDGAAVMRSVGHLKGYRSPDQIRTPLFELPLLPAGPASYTVEIEVANTVVARLPVHAVWALDVPGH